MYSNRIVEQFNRTVETAKALRGKNQSFRCFHYAALYKGKRLVSASFNLKKTHPKTLLYYPEWTNKESVHAEFATILKAGQESFEGFNLFVVRIDNNGDLNYSKPCRFCDKVVKKLNFDNVYYSIDKDKFERLNFI